MQISPVVCKGIVALLYKRHNTYLQARFFCHTMNYNLFEGYTTQFPCIYTNNIWFANCGGGGIGGGREGRKRRRKRKRREMKEEVESEGGER